MDLLSFDHLSDFQINLPNKVYKLHKVILNRCGYFNSLFRSENKENIASSIYFEYEYRVFDAFIDCLYGGATETDWESELTSELLDLAIYFQFEQLIDECVSLVTYSNSSLFMTTIIKYPHLVSKINQENLRKSCTKRIDDIVSLAEHIPRLDLLILILQTLQDASIGKIFNIITSWVKVNKISSIKSDIIDKIIDIPYSADYYIIRKLSNYNSELFPLLEKIMTNCMYYASNDKISNITNIEVDIDSSNYKVINNGRRFTSVTNQNLAIEISSSLNDKFDLVFHVINNILTLKVNQEVDLFCVITSSKGMIICKHLSLGYPVVLNTELFDNKSNVYRISLLDPI